MPHYDYVTPPHEPDHSRPTINADVHIRRVVPGHKLVRGRGREVVEVWVVPEYSIVPSSATASKKCLIIKINVKCRNLLNLK